MDSNSEADIRGSRGWDMRETASLVTTAYGVAQWNKAHPSARSMIDRPHFCNYHYHEAQGMLTKYIDSKLEDGLWCAFEDRQEFADLMMKIRANIIAFVQSLHALADTCAHMLYYSLALDASPKPLSERGINANSVLKLMQACRPIASPEYGKLCDSFSAMTSGAGYEYLAALTNTSKHRSVVRSSLSEDMTGERRSRWALLLESFRYDGKIYKGSDVQDFMRKEHDRMQAFTVDIGIELNEVLKVIQASKPRAS